MLTSSLTVDQIIERVMLSTPSGEAYDYRPKKEKKGTTPPEHMWHYKLQV